MSSGNPERDKILHRAINECIAVGEAPVYGNVRDKLTPYPGFDLTDDDLIDALRDMKLDPAHQGPTPVAREPVSRDTEAEPTANGSDSEPEAKITFEQAQHSLQLAQARLERGRVALTVANEAGKKTRATLAASIEAWQRQVDPLTPAERQQREIRSHLVGEAARRAANPRRGITRGAAFAAKRMVNGSSRGAFSLQQAARLGFKMPGSGR